MLAPCCRSRLPCTCAPSQKAARRDQNRAEPAVALGDYDQEPTQRAGRRGAVTQAFNVRPALLALSIEDAPDGQGLPVDVRTLRIGQSLVMFAVARTSGGDFAGSETADWSLD